MAALVNVHRLSLFPDLATADAWRVAFGTPTLDECFDAIFEAFSALDSDAAPMIVLLSQGTPTR